MNGIEFYEFLRNNYNYNVQPLYGNFTFCDWLYNPRNWTFSFRFNIVGNNPKAIPRNILLLLGMQIKKLTTIGLKIIMI